MTKNDFKIDRLMDKSFRIKRTDVDGDLHTHVKSRKLANTIINNVCNKKIPLNSRSYTLESMRRLSDDEEYTAKISEILAVRKSKGKKQSYRNSNKSIKSN